MEGSRFCGHCGARRPPTPGPCPACGFVDLPSPMSAAAQPATPEDRNILNTRIALLLLAVGVVASILPVGAVVGDVVMLAGGVLLITSSLPFGKIHRRNAILGLALGFGGAAASAMVAEFVVHGIPAAPASPADAAAWLASVKTALLSALALSIVLGGISAFGLVVITYSLQNQTGRALLWITLLLGIGLGLTGYAIVSQAFDLIISQVLTGQALNLASINAIFAELNGLAYLEIVPQALFAACYFLADLRIRHGVIPASTVPAANV